MEWKVNILCGNIKLCPMLCGMESEDALCEYETLPYVCEMESKDTLWEYETLLSTVWNGKRRHSMGI